MIINRSLNETRRRKKILIVNAYLDDSRQSVARSYKIPPAMGPVYLAGAFSQQRCDVRLYNEQFRGPLQDERVFAWPDMLVLTGVNTALDRMKQLTAYARTKNPKVIVIAGGPPIRALPRYAARFFDYACVGDVEELQQVVAATLGKDYVAHYMNPRYELADWIGRIGYAESTRYCNFHCSFCSLTGEGRKYSKYNIDDIRRQIVGLGRRKLLFFIDNNFYGNDRSFFLQRIDLLREMRREGYFDHWGALVSNDFFLKDQNLTLARESGCLVLFSGVESFDDHWLKSVNKNQNRHAPQVEMISKCLQAGIVFIYGLMLDVSTRSVDDLRRELEFITGTPEITLPSFLTLAIPLLNTPYFYECLAQGRILPHTRIRDLNSQTISLHPVDPLDKAVGFVREIISLRGYRRRALKHAAGFYRRYRIALNRDQMLTALGNSAYFCAQDFLSAPARLSRFFRLLPQRTHVSGTEILDPVYKPFFPVAARFGDYFNPTMLTDASGCLVDELAEDLVDPATVQLKKVAS